MSEANTYINNTLLLIANGEAHRPLPQREYKMKNIIVINALIPDLRKENRFNQPFKVAGKAENIPSILYSCFYL